MIGKLLDFVVGREPVLVTQLTAAAVGILMAWGLPISPEQEKALIALLVAFAAFVARKAVSPVGRQEPTE